MQKYLAKLLFNINIENGKDTSQFDEQIRIIESISVEQAFYKARSIGKREEESFLNQENVSISWHFIDVSEVYPLETMKDGDQVYSLSHKINDTNAYINYIRQKSMVIQAKSLTFA